MLADPRLCRRVGAAVLLLAIGAAVAVLLLSGRSLSPGFIVHVDFERIGNLKPGSKVLMCGRQVGEIVGVRLAPKGSFLQRKATAPGEPEEPRLTVDLWLRWRYQKHIHRNSEFFVNQLGLLGEQYLEIGAPQGEPAGAVAWGMHVRGADPPRIDRLLSEVHDTISALVDLLRYARPLGAEIKTTVDDVQEIHRTAGLGRPETKELIDRSLALIEDTRALGVAIDRGTHRGKDIRELRDQFQRLTSRFGNDLRVIGRKLDVLMARLDQASDLWSPSRRQRIHQTLQTFRRAISSLERLTRDADAVLALLSRGEGTVGGFMNDRELWDDLHYVHKVLKDQPWSLIVKPRHPTRE